MALPGTDGPGMVWQVRLGAARRGMAAQGLVRLVRQVRQGPDWQGGVRTGVVRSGVAGMDWSCEARPDSAWCGRAGSAWRGVAWNGLCEVWQARFCLAGLGRARQGVAGKEMLGTDWLCMERSGKAWLGQVWRGRNG